MNMRPKALAVYESVICLLNEGADINGITVSDIAEKAGIGKGTVYDYFPSKESLVVSALVYEVLRQAEELQKILEQEELFEARIFRVFSCMEQDFEEKHCFSRFLRLSSNTYNMSQALQQEMQKYEKELQRPVGILRDLYLDLQREGIASGTVPETAAALTISMKLLAYLIYLENRRGMQDMEREQMKRYLYRCMVSDLNTEI